MGDMEAGQCSICGSYGPLRRKYYHYAISDCTCCGSKDEDGNNQHIVLVMHCPLCEPRAPYYIRPSLLGEKYLEKEDE